MKTTIIIVLALFIATISCNKEKESENNYKGILIGSRIVDSAWNKRYKNLETNEINLLYLKSDTNIVCRTIRDTIWDIMHFNIKESDAIEFIEEMNENKNFKSFKSETINIEKQRIIEHKWFNDNDNIEKTISKTKWKTNEIEWSLEIRNDTLLEKMLKRKE